MKVYISGPITGCSNYHDKFEAAQKGLESQGLDVVNPANLDKIMPPSATHSEFMKICIPLLELCDCIYMLEGWQESKGAQIEFEYAYEHRLAITFEGGRA